MLQALVWIMLRDGAGGDGCLPGSWGAASPSRIPLFCRWEPPRGAGSGAAGKGQLCACPACPGHASVSVCWPKAWSRWQRHEELKWLLYSRDVPRDRGTAEILLQALLCPCLEPGERGRSRWPGALAACLRQCWDEPPWTSCLPRRSVPGEPLPAVAWGSPASLRGLRDSDGLWEQKLGLCCLPCSRAGKPALLQPQLCQPLRVPCSVGKALQARRPANAR